MKKFTLLIALLVTAICFSQVSEQSATARAKANGTSQKITNSPKANTAKKGAQVGHGLMKSISTIDKSATSGVSTTKATAKVAEKGAQITYKSIMLAPATADAADNVNGQVRTAGQVTVAASAYNGTAFKPEGAGLIYESGPYFNVAGNPDISLLENTTLGMTTLGFGAQNPLNNRMADDVILLEDYDITQVDVFAYQTGETAPTVNGVFLQVWDGDPSAGGTVIWGDLVTNVLDIASYSNANRHSESTPGTTRQINRVTIMPVGLSLAAGTYWFDWSFTGTGGSGPWAPPVAILGQAITGNGQQALAGVWGPALDGGANLDPQGIPIQVYGNCTSCGGGGCAIVGDCNLMDATPDDATSPDIWDRPFADGTCCSGLGPVSYDVYGPFTVDADGAYDFLSVQTFDGYLFVYQNCFDPLDQSTNYLAGDDDGAGGIGTSDILGLALVTGTDYYLVTTGFAAGDFGDFTNTITGPGNVSCGGGGGDPTCGSSLPNYTNNAGISPGPSSQEFGDFPDFSNAAADDFIVSGSGLAAICQVAITGTGAAIPVDAGNMVVLNIYDDAAGLPGNIVFTESFVGTDVDPDGDGDFVLDVTGAPTFSGGDMYWLSVVVQADFGVSGQWFWDGDIAGNGSAYVWQNPGKGFGTGCATWADGDTCLAGGGTTGPDLAMDITFLEIISGGGCTTGVFVDRASFDAETASGNMQFEDLAGGPGVVAGCDAPFSAAGNSCYAPGEIQPGIEILSSDMSQVDPVAYFPSGSFIGNAFDAVGSNYFVDYTVINFPNADVNSFGLDIYGLFGGGPMDIRIFGTGGLIDTQSVVVADPAGTFFGYIAGETIVSVEIESLGGAVAEFVAQISYGECTSGGPTDNDTCADATEVACDMTYLGDTSDNTDQGGFDTSADEWFKYTGSGDYEFVTFSLCDGGTAFDSRLSVFDACGGALVATNDDSCGLQSELVLYSDGVTTYYIAVEGFAGATGAFSMEVTCAPAPPPPANDDCGDAITISCGESILGSTNNATSDIGVAPDCVTTTSADGVWYTFTDNSGLVTDYTLTTCSPNTDYDTKISVYTGSCGAPPLTCVAGNDDDPSCPDFQSTVEFQSDGNSTFLILVHGFAGQTGDFELTLTCTPIPPPNDMIANSIDVDEIGFPYTDPQVAMPAATTEAGTPAGCDNAGAKGVWYNFVPEGDGTATASIITPGAGVTNLIVNNGPLAGNYNPVAAGFGGAIPTTPLTEDAALVVDADTTGDPNDACDPITNGGALNGKIAVLRRGSCEFGFKALAAQNEGAIAVVVVNNQPGDPIVMGGGAVGDQVTIPVVMISDVEGNPIVAELLAANTVNMTLFLDPAGFSSVTFYTAPDENSIETDLTLVDYFDNQCVPGIDASIPTVAGQAYYVYVVNHGAITDIVIDGTNLGVSDNQIEGFVYYPNPADSTINLQSIDMIEDVAIYSILGQRVVSQKVGAVNSQINVAHLATGTYVMKVTVNGQVGTYKLLKK